jgi:hypothetical protein
MDLTFAIYTSPISGTAVISFTCSGFKEWKVKISSIRFKNSGLKNARIADWYLTTEVSVS